MLAACKRRSTRIGGVLTGQGAARHNKAASRKPAALLCNFAWLVQRLLFASCSGRSLALSCLGCRFGAPVPSCSIYSCRSFSPQTDGLKIHGLASFGKCPAQRRTSFRIYEGCSSAVLFGSCCFSFFGSVSCGVRLSLVSEHVLASAVLVPSTFRPGQEHSSRQVQRVKGGVKKTFCASCFRKHPCHPAGTYSCRELV
jgi:hypothetical protein